MKILTFTCQQCAHQHDAEGDSTAGSIQKSRLKWCVPCKASTFHFAANSEGLARIHRRDVKDELPKQLKLRLA